MSDAPAGDLAQEKKFGFLLIAFLLGVLIGAPAAFYMGAARGRINVQVEAVNAGHAKYKITDSFGTSEFEWVPMEKK